MRIPPVMQNVGLVSAFYSQEVVYFSLRATEVVKISDLGMEDS